VSRERELAGEILDRVRELYRLKKQDAKFVPGKSRVHYGGRVFDGEEMTAAVESLLDFHLTLGEKAARFEAGFSRFLGVRRALVVNSGSSAILLALAALSSPRMENPLKPGDEVITAALAFPTTVAPIVQNGLVPVFVDVEEGTYNPGPAAIRQAIGEKTRAILIAHTLGNPAEMDEISRITREHSLYLVEDACDALGSLYGGRLTGTFGHVSAFSFYAAHHMTTGEGGALATGREDIFENALSIRDWGRACRCPLGEGGPGGGCPDRFGHSIDGLPAGYDHRYTYTNLGYNLKPLDLQCAIGLEQLAKLPLFARKRRENFDRLYRLFCKYEDYFILPRSCAGAEPSWFALPLTVRAGAGFSRNDIVKYLESCNIETRMLFAGNVLRQPGFGQIPRRVAGNLANTDNVMENSFFTGVYPGLTGEMLNYVEEKVDSFFQARRWGAHE
jgi:CDP-6-deoxy-D-xylo-4-hexulose-3-dehydrase